MNKLCVVAKNKETYFIKRLIEEVGEGVALFDPWTDFMLPEAELYLARTSGVYKNDLDLMILNSLPEEKVINPLRALKRFRSKSSQYQWFDEENHPALPWMALKNADPLNVEKFFRLYPEVLVKPDVGQGGWGIEVFRWEAFSGWWKKKKKEGDLDYLIQPFKKDATEYRYFFLKGADPIVLERKAKSGVGANFKREGEATLSKFPTEHQTQLDRVINESGVTYGALDILVDNYGMYVLELNTVPRVEQLEKVSQINVLKLILRHLVR